MRTQLTAMTTRKVSHQGCGRNRRWRAASGRFAGAPPLGALVTGAYWHSDTGAGSYAPRGRKLRLRAFRLPPGVTGPVWPLSLEAAAMHWHAKDPASCYSHLLGLALSITGLVTLLVES